MSKALHLILTFLLPFAAGANESQEDRKQRQIQSPEIRGEVLYIQGRIDSHIYDFISRGATDLKGVKTVELNSLGGNSTWSLEIARKIRALGVKTRISAGNVCASACVVIFSAGMGREAGRGTWLGIHGARQGAGYVVRFNDICFSNSGEEATFAPDNAGCREFLEEWHGAAMKLTVDSFRLMESHGVLPTLRETYLGMAEDPNWYQEGNVLRKADWILPAEDAISFGLGTELTDR